MLSAVVAVATILAFAGYTTAGRVVGLSITALCSATMAFFLMPPVFSLRVSQTHDLVTLAFYSAAGLVLARTTPSKRKLADRVEPDRGLPSLNTPRTDLSHAVGKLMSSDLAAQLRALDLIAPGDTFSLPCTHEESLLLLSEILAVALKTPGVQRISIYGTQLPGIHLLTVAAHIVWPIPLREVIIIGKRDEDCHTLMLPGWPLRWHASWFDNGYDRIFQISMEAGG